MWSVVRWYEAIGVTGGLPVSRGGRGERATAGPSLRPAAMRLCAVGSGSYVSFVSGSRVVTDSADMGVYGEGVKGA